ncbi:MAG: hypothetical protein IK022_03055 [Bacteroidales bacterium]|nr:hypothetical protein [Bacteroidales bacterium]
MTIAKRYEDYPSAKDFPMSNGNPGDVNYDEDIFVGYRHFDLNPETILYPFGFGLSYTSFEYSDLKISVKVTNTGKCSGREVLVMKVKLADLRRFDGYERTWKLDEGEYVISAAASSRDIRQNVTLQL